MRRHSLGKGSGTPLKPEATKDIGAEERLLSGTGSELYSILAGDVDLYSTSAKKEAIRRLFIGSEFSRQCYAQMVRYLKHLTFKKLHMKILAMKADTGNATLHLLHAMTDGDACPG